MIADELKIDFDAGIDALQKMKLMQEMINKENSEADKKAMLQAFMITLMELERSVKKNIVHCKEVMEWNKFMAEAWPEYTNEWIQMLDYELKYDKPNVYELADFLSRNWLGITGIQSKMRMGGSKEVIPEFKIFIKHYGFTDEEFLGEWYKIFE